MDIKTLLRELDLKQDEELYDIREIGDGNINYIYRLRNIQNGISFIIKKAELITRISEDMRLPISRNFYEAMILKRCYEILPLYTPEIYYINREKGYFIMEDLAQYSLLRNSLIDFTIIPNMGAKLAKYLAKNIFSTSVFSIDLFTRKKIISKTLNPDMCAITDDLFFVKPYCNDIGNKTSDALISYLTNNLWNNSKLIDNVAELREKFNEEVQSLLHGDFHTGSILHKNSDFKIIDPEFAFFGPAGFDLGILLANFIVNYYRAMYIDGDTYHHGFMNWILEEIKSLYECFITEFTNLTKSTDNAIVSNKHIQVYIYSIISDSIGFAGCEICRRIIGMAKLKDIESIMDSQSRKMVQIACLDIAVEFLLNWKEIVSIHEITKRITG